MNRETVIQVQVLQQGLMVDFLHLQTEHLVVLTEMIAMVLSLFLLDKELTLVMFQLVQAQRLSTQVQIIV